MKNNMEKRIKKTIRDNGVRWSFILVCMLVCQACQDGMRHQPAAKDPTAVELATERPTVEELKEFIGKYRHHLIERFGPPEDVKICLPSFPDENLSRAEIEDFYEQQPARILMYGDIGVRVNYHTEIVDIRRGAFGTFTPEKLTAEKLREFIGKTEKDLFKRFGLPENVMYFERDTPRRNASAEEIESFYEQELVRSFIYGDMKIYVNGFGRIVNIRHPLDQACPLIDNKHRNNKEE